MLRRQGRAHAGETARSPHDTYFYYWGKGLKAVRHGKWTLHAAHEYSHPDLVGSGGKPGKTVKLKIPESLFDMETDTGEQHPGGASTTRRLTGTWIGRMTSTDLDSN